MATYVISNAFKPAHGSLPVGKLLQNLTALALKIPSRRKA
jgi:hypothetical protein